MPVEYRVYGRELDRVMPEWEHKLWDEVSLAEVLKPYALGEVLARAPLRDRYRYWSDVARLVVLYSEGGIYLDCDVRPLVSFNPLRVHECFLGWSANRSNGTKVVSNAVMGSVPGHAFLWALICGLEQHTALHRGKRTVEVTGPLYVDKVRRDREWPGLKVLPEEAFYPLSIAARRRGERPDLGKSYAYHQWANTRK
jgi:mannosyltransferase OCH1-like enzyme